MFIRLGNRYLNSRQVVEIRANPSAQSDDNVTVILQDGSSHSGFMPDGILEALSEHIIPAQPGYEAHREFEFGWNDDEEIPAALEWKPVVAFIYEPASAFLEPITAEDGRLNRFAVRLPNGRIYTSYEAFFENVDEYRNYLVKELAKERTKVA